MLLNIVIDFVMLIAMALVSISGFILEIVIPSRHAVKFQGVTPWSSQLLGLGRHDWGEIHLWAGIVLLKRNARTIYYKYCSIFYF